MKYKDFVPPNYPDQLWNTRADGSLRIQATNHEPSKTQQQFQNECDINNILKSYQETGTINHLNPKPGLYQDFSNVLDYKDSLELVMYAQEQFALLPAKIRSRFNNNPAELVEFCNHPHNHEEAVSLGLANPQSIINANPNPNSNANTNNQPVPKPKKSPALNPQPTTESSDS